MRKVRQVDDVVIGCCVCLNQTGKKVPAASVVKGYAVCADHVKLVAKPGFDIFQLYGNGAPA